MNAPHLILCDFDRTLAGCWEQGFAGCEGVEVRCGDLLEVVADAYVSPANSYGAMDGGLDWVLRERFGLEIETRVQAAIGRERGGMLPVGYALVVPTEDADVPYLIVAPTMELPTVVMHTSNAFYAMRALLRAWQRFEAEGPGRIESIAVPGLCTGVGRMDPEVAAKQMRRGYDEFLAEQ
jgi:O-acetyl-ADP-ribose deacetylase (regulator of RNase III)